MTSPIKQQQKEELLYCPSKGVQGLFHEVLPYFPENNENDFSRLKLFLLNYLDRFCFQMKHVTNKPIWTGYFKSQ